MVWAFALYHILRKSAFMNLLKLYRRNDHAQYSSVHNGSLINGSNLAASVLELLHDLLTYCDVAHFTSLKAHYYSDLVPALQELYGVSCLGLEVVGVYTAGELNFLKLDYLLLFLGFLFLFVAFEAVLTVIHDTTYGRLCLRCHKNQVIALIVGDLQSCIRRHNSYDLALNINYSYFFCFDLLVDQQILCANVKYTSNFAYKAKKSCEEDSLPARHKTPKKPWVIL